MTECEHCYMMCEEMYTCTSCLDDVCVTCAMDNSMDDNKHDCLCKECASAGEVK